MPAVAPELIRSALASGPATVAAGPLHVITVLWNPCGYAVRTRLTREFLARMEAEKGVVPYLVELAYEGEPFQLAEADNVRHLQVRAGPLETSVLWQKENLVNLGVRELLPGNWGAVAWIDGDIVFERPDWATDTLRILGSVADIVQVFSHAVDMNALGHAIGIYPSFCSQYCRGQPLGMLGPNMWHSGYGWACTRAAWEAFGGLYEGAILGAGDHHMAYCLLGKGAQSIAPELKGGFREELAAFQAQVIDLRVAYVPGVIRHIFHGEKLNRRYLDRWKILARNAYDPRLHLVRREEDGLVVPGPACPATLLQEILEYFRGRREGSGGPEQRGAARTLTLPANPE